MKAFLVGVIGMVLVASVVAQQATTSRSTQLPEVEQSVVEGEVTKVYSMEDDGAKFRAYAVKYKGGEVIASDTMAGSEAKVGDKIKFWVFKVETQPFGSDKVKVMLINSFPRDLTTR